MACRTHRTIDYGYAAKVTRQDTYGFFLSFFEAVESYKVSQKIARCQFTRMPPMNSEGDTQVCIAPCHNTPIEMKDVKSYLSWPDNNKLTCGSPGNWYAWKYNERMSLFISPRPMSWNESETRRQIKELNFDRTTHMSWAATTPTKTGESLVAVKKQRAYF